MTHPESQPGSDENVVPMAKPEAAVDTGSVAKEITEAMLSSERKRLKEMREKGELSPHDFPWEEIVYFQQERHHVQRKDLGNRVLILTPAQIVDVGPLTVKWKDGIDREFDELSVGSEVIIFPDDLSD